MLNYILWKKEVTILNKKDNINLKWSYILIVTIFVYISDYS